MQRLDLVAIRRLHTRSLSVVAYFDFHNGLEYNAITYVSNREFWEEITVQPLC